MSDWTDEFVGDRMAVDREFTERITSSEFSSQEWGTIMTAVEFEIERPESPERAELVADTSRIETVMPALEDMQAKMGAMASGQPTEGRESSGEGLIGSIAAALGVGGDGSGDVDEQRLDAAESLAEEYASAFQKHLEREGKWERACERAAAEA